MCSSCVKSIFIHLFSKEIFRCCAGEVDRGYCIYQYHLPNMSSWCAIRWLFDSLVRIDFRRFKDIRFCQKSYLYLININYSRDDRKSTVTGWGSGIFLQASDLEIISQSYCNRKYRIPWSAPDHNKHALVKSELPNLLQDNLLCAAHDVSTNN